MVCRYGGEEFLITLPGATPEDTQLRAEALRRGIKQLQTEADDLPTEPVSLSLGVAAVPQHGTTMEEVIEAADQALYRAKAEGRDCVVVKGSFRPCKRQCVTAE
jgi:diguanylate cyclase (GGDEF)-like protein